MPWHSWLRHCTTSRKVAGSNRHGVTGIFHWQSFRPHYGPGVDSISNRNEYQEYFLGWGGGEGSRCVGLTTLPPSCTNCLEIWESQPPETLRACPGCNGIALPASPRWSTQCPGCFTPKKETWYPLTWGWVGPRAGLDGCRKSRSPPQSWFPGCSAHSKSLYCLHCPAPFITTADKNIKQECLVWNCRYCYTLSWTIIAVGWEAPYDNGAIIVIWHLKFPWQWIISYTVR